MPYTSTIDLEKLELRFARARLRGTATAQICVSFEQFRDVCGDVAALEKLWVRKGRDLRVQISCLLDGQPLESSARERVEGALRNAKMWKQLHFRTSQDAPLTPAKPSDTMTVHLSHSIEEQDEHKSNPSIYDICYRTPAKDIAPPRGTRTADLNVVRISLLLTRTKSRSRARKRRKTESSTMFDDPEEDEMLFPSQEQQSQEELTEADAVLAMVDGALRMNILGDVGRNQPLASGLSAKFVGPPTSLASIAPAVFARPELGSAATRAALLPTVAHALSSSLVTQARSPAVRETLERLCEHTGLDAPQHDDTEDSPQRTEAFWKFEAASARLWQFLQCRMRARPRTLKLDRVGAPSQRSTEQQDDDEDLFASHAHELNRNKDLFASQLLEDSDDGDDNDLFASPERNVRGESDLFASQEGNEWEEDEDLFASQEKDEWEVHEDLFALEHAPQLGSFVSERHILQAWSDRRVGSPWLEEDEESWISDRHRLDHDDGLEESEDEDLFEAYEQGRPMSMPAAPLADFESQRLLGPAGPSAGFPFLFSAGSDSLDIVDDSDDDLLLDLKLDERMSDE